MTTDLKLSLCITNYNRTDLLLESFSQVLNDDRISEIIICDDGSNITTMQWYNIFNLDLYYKIKLHIHPGNNVGMYENKKRAIEYASNEWCILFDSDNVITSEYVDAFFNYADDLPIYINTIYCPDFAKPQFDYTSFVNTFYGKEEVQEHIQNSAFECCLNTCNYIVSKTYYLKAWEPAPTIGAADSIYFMYLWLKSGWDFYIIPDMQYYHRVHEGSGFLQNVNENMKNAKHVKELIKSL